MPSEQANALAKTIVTYQQEREKWWTYQLHEILTAAGAGTGGMGEEGAGGY